MSGLRNLAALGAFLSILFSATAAAGTGRVVTDRILRVPLPAGWSGSVGPGRQGTHPVAWILAASFALPAGAAGHEGVPPVPRSKVLLAIGDFYPTARSARWPLVKSLRMPGRLIRSGRWWQVRYAGRALAIQATFGSRPSRQLVSEVERVLASVHR
jgi:hypothetical protein